MKLATWIFLFVILAFFARALAFSATTLALHQGCPNGGCIPPEPCWWWPPDDCVNYSDCVAWYPYGYQNGCELWRNKSSRTCSPCNCGFDELTHKPNIANYKERYDDCQWNNAVVDWNCDDVVDTGDETATGTYVETIALPGTHYEKEGSGDCCN